MSGTLEPVSIVAAGGKISGWEDVNITLRAEAFPNNFDIVLSSVDPVTGAAPAIKDGTPVKVLIGSDPVVTGYVDKITTSGTKESHFLSIVGRGKTQDLVDCSAEYGSGAITNATALDISKRLCQAYSGLAAVLASGADAGPRVEQLLVDYTEKAAGIIQRVAQNAGLLAFESAAGELVLARAGTRVAASGAVYGQNVEAYSITASMDERYSEVCCVRMSQDTLIGFTPLADSDNLFHTETDPNVPRHRRLVIALEQAADPEGFTERKAKWEVTRRAGRSTQVAVTVDSWRDAGGTLWEPNTIIPVQVPGLPTGGSKLIISEVTFHRSDERGTVADLILMPPEAFTIEPISLIPVNLMGFTPVPAATGS